MIIMMKDMLHAEGGYVPECWQCTPMARRRGGVYHGACVREHAVGQLPFPPAPVFVPTLHVRRRACVGVQVFAYMRGCV